MADCENLKFIHENHLSNKSVQDVKMVTFINSKVNFIQTDLLKFFTNVETLDISKSQMTKWTRGDLKDAKKWNV